MKNLSAIFKYSKLASALCLVGFSLSSFAEVPKSQTTQLEDSVQIAFMPDLHFSDVYSDISDSGFTGLPNSKSGKKAVIRTMYAQLTSTRLFNENYFAMLAALDDAAKRGVKYIALPGDFSDDGQPMHMRGFYELIDRYREEHGMVFFAAPGNHDPVKPYFYPTGKSDFLAPSGKDQPIYATAHPECLSRKGASATSEAVICTDDAGFDGYQPIMEGMKNYGFYPKADYLYYETPFTTYDIENYSYGQAVEQAQYENRLFEICHEGTGGRYKQDHYTNCAVIPDTSYLVEPVKGLWLLSIDANVFVPTADADMSDPTNPDNFHGASNAGYNKMLTHKQHTIEWMTDIAGRAEEEGKTLVAFSHYPMGDFYNDASGSLGELFGEESFQLRRVPRDNVIDALVDTGIKLHVGGHMHFNGTSVASNENGFMFNVQAPSIAAYVPAYKLLTVNPDETVEVKTVVMDEVDRFDELFEHYEVEHEFLAKNAPEKLWDKSILEVSNYAEMNEYHLKELTRLRFLPQEWDEQMRNMLFTMSGKDMLILSQLDSDISLADLQEMTGKSSGADELLVNDKVKGKLTAEVTEAWSEAEKRAVKLAEKNHVSLDNMESWTGFDLTLDFYRMRSAGELAKSDIEPEALKHYSMLADVMANTERPGLTESEPRIGDIFKTRFGLMFDSLQKLSSGAPSDHFMLDLKQGRITDLAS